VTRSRAFPVVLAGFSAFLVFYATQPLLPYLARTFGASEFLASLTVTAPTVAVALTAPVVGRLADRLGMRRLIVWCAFALAASTLLAASAATLTQLIVWRFIQGLFTPGVFALAIAYIHQEWPPSRASGVTAAYVGGTVAGGFLGRVLAGVVSASWGWQRAFVILSAISFAAAVLIAWLMPEESRPRHATTPGKLPLRRIARNRELVATFVIGAGILCTQMAAFTYVTFHLAGPPFFLSTAALGWLFATYLLGAVVTPIAGRWIDRHGRRRAFLVTLTIGMAATLLMLVPSLASIMIALAMMGTSVFVTQATASSHVAALAPASRGLALGIYSTCYYAGGSFGGAFPSLFWERGGWAACVAFIVAVQAAMLTMAWVFWTETPHDERLVAEVGL
jgi:predicted MFS family arabinose efflux permease